MQTVISFRTENLCWLNTLYCFVAVNTRHPSVWLVVDLQSISESSLYSLQQKDCFLMSSLWMKGVRRLVPFSDTVPEISTVYWSQSRETRELLTASALPAPAKQTDYSSIPTSSMKHLCTFWVKWGCKNHSDVHNLPSSKYMFARNNTWVPCHMLSVNAFSVSIYWNCGTQKMF